MRRRLFDILSGISLILGLAWAGLFIYMIHHLYRDGYYARQWEVAGYLHRRSYFFYRQLNSLGRFAIIEAALSIIVSAP
jgi:hypothetical protein